MSRRTGYYEADVIEKIRKLEDDLWSARYTIIHLMPEGIQEILEGYYSCRSSSDTHTWENTAAHEIIAFAKILSPEEGSYWTDRAYCPLCGDGAQSFYERGFSVPEGLFRHLVGWGNANQCRVFGAAIKLARDHWRREFSESDEAERREKLRRMDERKNTEILYRISPFDDPVLIDEGIWSTETARDQEQMLWAEGRLSTLGFEIELKDRTKCYLNETDDSIVLADPRKLGEISFAVYKKPLPKKSTRPYRIRQAFCLKDNWKHDLPAKYQTRVIQARASIK